MQTLIFFAILFVTNFPRRSQSQFPLQCTTSEALNDRVCCPVELSTGLECGGPGRGSCELLEPYPHEDYQPHFEFIEDDERAQWPTAFFDKTCRCSWPFWGPSCDQCVFGYYGESCTESKMIIRRNILKDDEARNKMILYSTWAKGNDSEMVVMNTFLQNMKVNGTIVPEFSRVSVYDFFVWVHHYACMFATLDDFIFVNQDFAHFGPAFMPWHRTFLMLYERALQSLANDYDFALPYWNWAGELECDVCTDDYFGASDENGLLSTSSFFKDWTTICYSSDLPTTVCDPGVNTGPIFRYPLLGETLPLATEAGFLWNLEEYDTPPYNPMAACSWRNIMGGNGSPHSGLSSYTQEKRFLHGQVHLAMGGIMSDVPSSANDPLFYSHHSMVDRLYESWMRMRGGNPEMLPESGAPYGHNRLSRQVPFLPTITHADMFRLSYNFGYDYDDVDDKGITSDYETLVTDDSGYCMGIVNHSSIQSDNDGYQLTVKNSIINQE